MTQQVQNSDHRLTSRRAALEERVYDQSVDCPGDLGWASAQFFINVPAQYYPARLATAVTTLEALNAGCKEWPMNSSISRLYYTTATNTTQDNRVHNTNTIHNTNQYNARATGIGDEHQLFVVGSLLHNLH